jgi:hypothetical protein
VLPNRSQTMAGPGVRSRRTTKSSSLVTFTTSLQLFRMPPVSHDRDFRSLFVRLPDLSNLAGAMTLEMSLATDTPGVSLGESPRCGPPRSVAAAASGPSRRASASRVCGRRVSGECSGGCGAAGGLGGACFGSATPWGRVRSEPAADRPGSRSRGWGVATVLYCREKSASCNEVAPACVLPLAGSGAALGALWP